MHEYRSDKNGFSFQQDVGKIHEWLLTGINIHYINHKHLELLVIFFCEIWLPLKEWFLSMEQWHSWLTRDNVL